jgi:hypothetical protein
VARSQRWRAHPRGRAGDSEPSRYHWAAEQIVARRLAGELRNDPVEYANALRHETQSLRHRAHERLMRAFLDPEVFSDGVRVVDDEPADAQTRLTV